MEVIEQMVVNLRTELESTISSGDVSGLSVQDINKIITYKDRICGGPWEDSKKWDENRKKTQDFKQRYLNCEGVPMDRKLEAILTWGDSELSKNMNSFKGEIIAHLNNGLGFETVWDLLKKGKLIFGKEDAKELLSAGQKFIEFINKRKMVRPCKKCDDDEEEDEDNTNHINMTPIEKFFINLLMCDERSESHGVREADAVHERSECKVMKLLTTVCDPRLHFLPQKVTRFNGELVSQIIPHYKNNFISPIIDCRRSLGVILENQRSNFYEYEDFVENNGRFLATQITIELPYMCYGYIQEIELDLMDIHGGGVKPKMFISTGSEYVVYPFQKCKKWEKGTFDTCETLRQKCPGGDMPCTYVSIHFGFTCTLFPSIKAIRLYGDAVSFI
jgi:hypothetical protein